MGRLYVDWTTTFVKDGGRKHRSLEERLSIYDRIQELKSKGMTYAEMAAQLAISVDEVGYWLKAGPPSVQRYSPDLTPRAEIAYLVGVYFGDGRTAGPQDKKVRFHVADLDFANLLNELVAKVLGAIRKPLTFERGYHSVDYDSAILYDFLQQPIEAYGEIIKKDPSMFLRGFFDAEGYATQTVRDRFQTLTAIRVGAANCELDYLDVVRKTLQELQIRSTLRVTKKAGQMMKIRDKTYARKRDVYHAEIISLPDVRLFRTKVDFAIPRKKEKLNHLVEIMNMANPVERYGRFTSLYERVGRKWVRKAQ